MVEKGGAEVVKGVPVIIRYRSISRYEVERTSLLLMALGMKIQHIDPEPNLSESQLRRVLYDMDKNRDAAYWLKDNIPDLKGYKIGDCVNCFDIVIVYLW